MADTTELSPQQMNQARRKTMHNLRKLATGPIGSVLLEWEHADRVGDAPLCAQAWKTICEEASEPVWVEEERRHVLVKPNAGQVRRVAQVMRNA